MSWRNASGNANMATVATSRAPNAASSARKGLRVLARGRSAVVFIRLYSHNPLSLVRS